MGEEERENGERGERSEREKGDVEGRIEEEVGMEGER